MATKAASGSNSAPPKFEHPKIMLFDCADAMTSELRSLGYNVSTASFGKFYSVPNDGGWRPAIPVGLKLNGLPEQEIVIIDLTEPPKGEAPGFNVGVGQNELWVRCISGSIDPRPREMAAHQRYFDRILDHGGQFIIFAAAREVEKYVPGRLKYRDDLDFTDHEIELDNWSFLSCASASNIEISFDHGNEMKVPSSSSGIFRILSEHLPDSSFNCVFVPRWIKDQWLPLALNKYKATVAGFIHNGERKGSVFIVPDLADKTEFVKAVLQDVLPNRNPALFPGVEGAGWVHRREYEVPRIQDLQLQIEETRQQANETVEKLQDEIASERESSADWYTLLRGTGDELVQAVMRTLGALGFEKVIDVDAKEPDPPGGKREDLQIHDQSPTLIVDIKGVQGHPEDAESTQSEKHATMRMREWKRTDVQPLTIINHQRHLPPRDRDQKAYRSEIIKNAEQTGVGLMTCWDLWKLARNARALSWPKESVLPIFYRKGRIEPIPEHYREVGRIVKTWEKAFGVVPTVPLAVGDRLAVEVDDTFREFVITTLHVDNAQVGRAVVGSNCGVAFADASKHLRENARVFLILRAT